MQNIAVYFVPFTIPFHCRVLQVLEIAIDILLVLPSQKNLLSVLCCTLTEHYKIKQLEKLNLHNITCIINSTNTIFKIVSGL